MIYTNDYKLPLPVAQALKSSDYDPHGDYSCTGLIGPPRIHFLTKRHYDDIVVDVMDMFYALRGTALHYILSQVKHRRAIVEERFLYHFEGYEISIKGDLIWPEHETANEFSIYDYKACATYVGKMKKPKDEWVKQLNIIRVGMLNRGITCTKLGIVAFFNDWSALDAKINSGRTYPQQPIMVIDVPIIPEEQVKKWMSERIKLFESCKGVEDDALPVCTAEERWSSPDCYAVVHVTNGVNGRAVSKGGSFDTEQKAYDFKATCANAEKKAVEFRQGNNKRCKEYCSVKHFCSYYKTKVSKEPF